MRANKETWIEEGLEILATEGVGGITIDSLSRRLHLTKGSFYHHFKDRADFLAVLLDHWEERSTSNPIEITEESLDPIEKFNILSRMAVDLPKGPEIAIRTWALYDPLAKSYQERVDQRRFEYLVKIAQKATGDVEQAKVAARIIMAVYIGTQYVVPMIEGEQLQQVLNEIRDRLL